MGKAAGEWYYVVDDSHAIAPCDEYVLRIADGYGGFRSVGGINDEGYAKWIVRVMNKDMARLKAAIAKATVAPAE